MPIPQRAPTMSLSCSFVINLGQGTDKLGLHFNPRFKESTIVCNSRDGSQWGREQRENHLCFSPGSEVKVRCGGSAQPAHWHRLGRQAPPRPLPGAPPVALTPHPPSTAHDDL